MKYAGILCRQGIATQCPERRTHRDAFGVWIIGRVLRVHFSGIPAWLEKPFSHRALEDARQSDLVRQARAASGKVRGYRKLTDDVRRARDSVAKWPAAQ